MSRGQTEVIRTKLRLWERNGLKRYYFNDWDRFFDCSIWYDYQKEYGVDPFDKELGIRVFFDKDGFLFIDNCHDPGMKMVLEDRMKDWYHRAEESYNGSNSMYVRIIDLISPFMKELKPGFYQVGYKGCFFNLDEDMMCHYRWAGYVTYRFRTKEYVVETGNPRFDEILVAIAIDERAGFPGSDIPSCLG
ncbi:MAG: hypothetical protein IKH39_08940 [Candidatus Methanomethylophilaceae archaeon]|nr:hypothetical protein [Candidatus Methanomethylophilaceae archaeon]